MIPRMSKTITNKTLKKKRTEKQSLMYPRIEMNM